MTEQIEIRIPFNDLTKITIECPSCRAETSLDISDPKQRGLEALNHKFVCTVCATPFDSRLKDAVIAAFSWYDAIKDANLIDKISFRIQKTTQ